VPTCFVIQPFDGGTFDQRYEDTFEPAIKAAGLTAYRVDRDPAADIPIDQIHAKIAEAAVCLAEITTDNPNVWYELGYAFASGKQVVMICATARERFPFDIQHRSIIRYGTASRRDWEHLASNITQRLQAAMRKEADLQNVTAMSPIAEIQGLSQQEIVALVVVAENMDLRSDVVSPNTISERMKRNGFTKIAVRLALDRLERKEMITTAAYYDHQEQMPTWTGYQVTDRGMQWLGDNEDKLVLRHPPEPRDGSARELTEDDIPF
jgi:nucleoside 2-deoxyribosyltransferase